MKKLFHLNFTKDTTIGLTGGIIVILLSLCMNFFPGTGLIDTAMSILLRDVLMILVIGFWGVFHYVLVIKKESLACLGFHKKKLWLSLILNLIFAVCLLFGFMRGGEKIHFTYSTMCAVSYILVAGIFEMVFIYGFLRYIFEKAFGIIPAIFLTSIFYSLHHAGFQPEFTKLFFVGMMYVAVYYITQNLFIIFPFFWGVGAIWDVLANSTAGESIANTTSFIVAICVAVGMLCIWIYYHHLSKHYPKRS